MKLTVFGSSGKTGKLLLKKALEQGHMVKAYTRNPTKIGIQHPNLTIVPGRLAEPETIDATIAGSDCVISLLGPTSKTRGKVISDATKCILRSMKQHAVHRIIATSTPSFKSSEDRFQFTFSAGTLFVKYFIPDAYLNIVETGKLISESELDWTIVRIPLLNDEAPEEKLKTGFLGDGNVALKSISRLSVVEFLLKQVNDKTWIKKAPVISG